MGAALGKNAARMLVEVDFALLWQGAFLLAPSRARLLRRNLLERSTPKKAPASFGAGLFFVIFVTLASPAPRQMAGVRFSIWSYGADWKPLRQHDAGQYPPTTKGDCPCV
jgi:hypothetical protein